MNKFIQRADKYNKRKKLDTIVLEPRKLDEAVVGVRIRHGRAHVVYSYYKLVTAFVKHEGMTIGEAVDWVEYNTIRSLPYMNQPGCVPPVVGPEEKY